MRELSLNEYRNKIYEILLDVDSFCNKNKICYYLDSGTLLGAVRHKGFIPWDDDIDLVMPRKDYERFINIFNTSKCEVLSMHNCHNYYYQFAKIYLKNSSVIENIVPEIKELGINIDVFPIDGMPNNFFMRRFHQDFLLFLSKFRTFVVIGSKKIGFSNYSYLIWKPTIKLIDHLGKKYPMNNSKYCGNIVATSVRHKESKVSCFVSSVKLPFEDNYFPAPNGYNEYLTDLFGNYMELPPVEQQVPKHNFSAYIND